VKNFLVIIAAVASYSIFETALLLVYLLPPSSYHPLRDPLLAIVHLFTIPGLSVLFSLILFGTHQWRPRVAVRLLTAPGFVLLLVLTMLPLGLLATILEKKGIDLGGSSFFAISSVLWWIVFLAIVVILSFLINKKARERSVELETSRWLTERQAEIAPRAQRLRGWAIRLALWIPSVMVLTLFLFLPEVWGLLTHLRQPRAGELPGYQVIIPATWIIVSHYENSLTGSFGASGIVGDGLGIAVRRYLHPRDLPLSSWGVGVSDEPQRIPRRWVLSLGEVRAHHEFQIGKTALSCSEYLPSWGVFVECSNSDRLHATFTGEKVHVPAFYKMVAGITQALPTIQK